MPVPRKGAEEYAVEVLARQMALAGHRQMVLSSEIEELLIRLMTVLRRKTK